MINRIIGSYKILEKIGEGGMGVVYKAIHTKLDQFVAIKILFPQYSRDINMQNKLKKKWRRKKKVQTVEVSSPVNVKGTSTGQSYLNSDKFNQEDENTDLQEILKRNKLLPVP